MGRRLAPLNLGADEVLSRLANPDSSIVDIFDPALTGSTFLILIMWNDTDTALAYLISFRTYGTWLHGDKRGSVDRFHNRYCSPYLPPNKKWISTINHN